MEQTSRATLFFEPPEAWTQAPAADARAHVALVQSALGLKGIAEEDADRAAILDDMLLTAHKFAEEHRLGPLKTWTFLCILAHLHSVSVGFAASGAERRPLRMEESFSLFKRQLVAHSVQRPPYSVRVFGLDEGKLLTRFVTHTYFLHFRLYQHVFTRRRLLDLTQRCVAINVAPELPPLAQGQLQPPTARSSATETVSAQ